MALRVLQVAVFFDDKTTRPADILSYVDRACRDYISQPSGLIPQDATKYNIRKLTRVEAQHVRLKGHKVSSDDVL